MKALTSGDVMFCTRRQNKHHVSFGHPQTMPEVNFKQGFSIDTGYSQVPHRTDSHDNISITI